MQIDITRSEDVSHLIDDAKNIGIIACREAGLDPFCAAAALYYMLKTKGKTVSFVFPGELPDSVKELITPDNVIADLKSRNLIVSVDYSGTKADKVKYNTENSILTFRLGPVASDFDAVSRVTAKVASFDFDLTFVIGAATLEDLGETYTSIADELHASKIVNIDNSKRNTRFGIINIIDLEIDTISLLIFQKAVDWRLHPNKDAAKALLKGMSA